MRLRRWIVVIAALMPTVGISAEPVRQLACEGVFSPDTTHAKIVKAFGKENVTIEIRIGESPEDERAVEDDPEMMTVIYPNDPAVRLEVEWKKRFREPFRIKAFLFSGGRSNWRFMGVKKNDPIETVEAINGKPFRVGEHPSFQVRDWRGGRLSTPARLGCKLQMYFHNTGGNSYDNPVRQGGEFLSDNINVRALKPRVSYMELHYD